MPEWPEIHHLARQMAQELPGIALCEARIAQPKCLNLPEEAWRERVLGRAVQAVRAKGKWLDVALEGGYRLRINLGMGGEILLSEAGEAPAEKWRALFSLADGRKISIHFWWFGSLHAVGPGEAHPPFDKLGLDMLSVDEQDFTRAYAGRRSPVKVLLLKQEILSGMGNYYVHDVLFRAGLHPARSGDSLSGEEWQRLYSAVREVFLDALAMGGSDYERDLYNQLGRYSAMQVGYREGLPCPVCGTAIVSQRVGAANSYFCPHCQQ